MTLRTLTFKPKGCGGGPPADGLLTATYDVGRFRVTFNRRVAPEDGQVSALSTLMVWKPHTPVWDDLNTSDRAAYRAARNRFAQVVANATGVDVVILESDEP